MTRRLPVFFRDPAGSTFAVMRFPDDLEKAKAWHAQMLAAGPLKRHRGEGHDFEDRVDEFLDAVASRLVDEAMAKDREAAGAIAGEAIALLHTLVDADPGAASWSRAIRDTARAFKCSDATVRNHLRLFASVAHLWGSWRLHDRRPSSLDDLWSTAGGLLVGLRLWQEARPSYLGRDAAYLRVEEFGPWEGWQLPHEFRVRVPPIDPAAIAQPARPGRPRKPAQT